MTTTSSEPHRAREVAESFGVDAARYDRSRPRYPDAMIDAIVAGSPGRDVLDIGIGTGIVARQFRAAGCTVLGVEPDARMAEFARDTGLAVEVAKIEDWATGGRRFDAAVSGQAWHWIDPVAESAKAAEALRPGGRLAVFWNASQPPVELEKAFGAVFRKAMPDSPITRMAPGSAASIYAAMCDKTSDGIRQSGTFGEPEQWKYEWDLTYTRDEWLEVSATTGATTLLPKEVLEEVLAGLGAAIDAAGGSLVCHYTTMAVTAVRR